MDPERFVFLDETATTTDMGRRYGRSPLGERLMAAVPQGHWKTTTFVAGLRQSGIVAPLVLDGPMTGAAFCAYVEQFLRARSPAPGGMALSGREAAVRRRSLQDLVATLGELRAAGVDLFLHQQAIDTTTPSGRAMFQMLGVFAEFERAMIVERVKAGLARARAAGRRLGRPRVRADEEGIRRAVEEGLSIRRTAQQFGVSPAKVQRVLALGAADRD
jgi:GAF domain-containing protein